MVEVIMDMLSVHDLLSAYRCACGAHFDADSEWTEARRHVAEKIVEALDA